MPYSPRFSSAPRCQRSRWAHSARQVGITSVTTVQSAGETTSPPSVLQGQRDLVVLGEDKRVVDVAGNAGQCLAALVGQPPCSDACVGGDAVAVPVEHEHPHHAAA